MCARKTSGSKQAVYMSDTLILVAVDFSKGSKVALLWAIDFADETNASLLIVHVAHDPASKPGSYERDDLNILEPIVDIAQKQFDKFIEKTISKRPDSKALKTMQTLLVTGLPHKRILAIAKQLDAKHIVMGCLGKGKLPNVFVGSVAMRVLKKTTLPVTIIRAKPGKKKIPKDT